MSRPNGRSGTRQLCWRALLTIVCACASAACDDANGGTTARDAVTRDAGSDSEPEPDAGADREAGAAAAGESGDSSVSPAQSDDVRGCPVHVSLITKSYGTGNNDDDDYAPNNVGAIWITDPAGTFVRTIAAWGPNYWSFAETWLKQSNGSRVDIVSGATRRNHEQPVEADWDCRNKDRLRVPAGAYRVNVEFAESEEQGPLLTGDAALPFEIGPAAHGVTRDPSGAFGSIDLVVAQP
jgi:hypothetical protein